MSSDSDSSVSIGDNEEYAEASDDASPVAPPAGDAAEDDVDDELTIELLAAARAAPNAEAAEMLLRPLVEIEHLGAVEYYVDRCMTAANASREAFDTAKQHWASRPPLGVVRAILELANCSGEWDELSVAPLRSAVEDEPGCLVAALLLGDVLRDVCEDCAGARKYWQRALAINPRCRGAWMRLGQMALDSDAAEEEEDPALDDSAVRAGVGTACAHFRSALAIDAADDYEDAIAHFALGSAQAKLLTLRGDVGADGEAALAEEKAIAHATAMSHLERAVVLSPQTRVFQMMRDTVARSAP
jgi:hypothetical protein